MKALIRVNPRGCQKRLCLQLRCVLGQRNTRRYADLPAGESSVKSTHPFRHAGLSGVDFLSATDQADNHTPPFVAIHNTDEELRLRHIEVGLPSLSLHERSGLLASPGTLRLVKYDDFLDRNIVVADVLISEMMDVLDEG